MDDHSGSEVERNDCPKNGMLGRPFLLSRGRFVPAVLVAVSVHAAVFWINISSKPVMTAPRPLQVERIAVSLGSRPVPKKEEPVRSPEPKPQPITEPVSEPAPDPVKQPPEAEPEPVLKPRPVVRKKTPAKMLKPRPVRKKKVAQPRRPTAKKVQQAQPQKNMLPSTATKRAEDSSQTRASARVIRKATPLYQVNPPPKYPRLARRRGYEGLVVLMVTVNPSGSPAAVRLLSSSGYLLLDKAAIKAIGKWRFQPGTVDGVPRQMTVKVPVRFRLERSNGA